MQVLIYANFYQWCLISSPPLLEPSIVSWNFFDLFDRAFEYNPTHLTIEMLDYALSVTFNQYRVYYDKGCQLVLYEVFRLAQKRKYIAD